MPRQKKTKIKKEETDNITSESAVSDKALDDSLFLHQADETDTLIEEKDEDLNLDNSPIQGSGQEFTYEIKIPKDRIAVLIGKSGETKKKIETETHIKLNINSKDGDVSISGEDALGLYTAREVVRAISRGFNPEYALQLLKSDYSFEVFNIIDYVGKNKNAILRLKGRIIGKEGKARRIIEELTEANLCVYGKTIGIIGEIENVSIARRAVQSLLSGAPHSNVYRWLEHRRKELKMKNMLEREI